MILKKSKDQITPQIIFESGKVAEAARRKKKGGDDGESSILKVVCDICCVCDKVGERL